VKYTLIARRKIQALTFANSENNSYLNPNVSSTVSPRQHIRIGCAKMLRCIVRSGTFKTHRDLWSLVGIAGKPDMSRTTHFGSV